LKKSGAGEGNRTLVVSLASSPPTHESYTTIYDLFLYSRTLREGHLRRVAISCPHFPPFRVPSSTFGRPEVHAANQTVPSGAGDESQSVRYLPRWIIPETPERSTEQQSVVGAEFRAPSGILAPVPNARARSMPACRNRTDRSPHPPLYQENPLSCQRGALVRLPDLLARSGKVPHCSLVTARCSSAAPLAWDHNWPQTRSVALFTTKLRP
jgi:hypothetical protein